MFLGSPITWTSTLVGMSTRQTISFCLCCFSQVLRHLWSLHGSGICCHTTSTPVGTSIQPAGSFCLCCFSQVVGRLWSLHVSGIPHHTDLHSSSNIYPTSWFILSVLSLHVSGICCHMDILPSRNLYPTSQFILSVLFLTGSVVSVVPIHVWDPKSP